MVLVVRASGDGGGGMSKVESAGLRQPNEWKTDEEFRALLMRLNNDVNKDDAVVRACAESHKRHQEALLASDVYRMACSSKLEELYLRNGIDPSSLEGSRKAAEERIERRRRYIANGCAGEF